MNQDRGEFLQISSSLACNKCVKLQKRAFSEHMILYPLADRIELVSELVHLFITKTTINVSNKSNRNTYAQEENNLHG